MGAPPQKLFSAVLGAALSLPFAGSVLYNVAVDPFEILRQSRDEPAVFLGSGGLERYTHAGIIRHYDPNAIVIGHSHAANFLPSQVDARLGFRNTYSLTVSGATLFEQSVVARHALTHASIENVLWVFTTDNLTQKPSRTHARVPIPQFLYDNDWFNDISLFITLPMDDYSKEKARKRSALVALSKVGNRRVDPRDYSTAWYWEVRDRFNRPERVVQHILGKRKGYAMRAEQVRRERPLTKREIASLAIHVRNYRENLERNVLPIITAKPYTKFRIIIDPPFPLMTRQVQKIYNYQYYERHLAIVYRLVHDLAPHSNVEVYGFGTLAMARDLRLYKDKTHYHLKLNNIMLTKIAKGENRLTSANVLDYLVQFDAQVHQFVLPDEWNPEKATIGIYSQGDG